MARKSKAPQKTKLGMRIISPDDDLSALFEESSDSDQKNKTESASHTEHAHLLKKHPQEEIPVNKIPDHIRHTPADSYDDDNFEAMLEASWSKTTIKDILAEKYGNATEDLATTREIVKTHPAPQMQIDLHGCNREEAERLADSFIYNASYKGLKTVRIIVGKGIHSAGKAVLPDVIETKIIALKREQVVLSYGWEKRQKHKSGAMIVYLT
ncbi:Smr/MutS family protein [Desulfococcaceae bacterium HSG7]|nr:Smr/MutS family protein [Desulfococcaceae bacterium HSG7]